MRQAVTPEQGGAPPANLLLEPVTYKVTRERFGSWRMYASAAGWSFAEYTSHARPLGIPLVHYVRGRNPETGGRKLALGWIAVGRFAAGVLPIGQVSAGILPLGQVAIGGIAIGQAAFGIAAAGQVAIGAVFAIGQIACGYGAIGQMAFGKFALGQKASGWKIWTGQHEDPEAVEFFLGLLKRLRDLLP